MDLDDVLEAVFLALDSSTSDIDLSSHTEQAGDRTGVVGMSPRNRGPEEAGVPTDARVSRQHLESVIMP
jgi:hypothetical protein